MSEPTKRRDRLVVLFLLGSIAFNYPLLSLFARGDRLLGLPVLYIYLFGVWAAFITLIWWLLSGRRDSPPDRSR